MSVLTGPEIARLAAGNFGVRGERIVLCPFRPDCIGPNSVDVHLGDTLLVYDVLRGVPLDPERLPRTVPVPLAEEIGTPGWVLEPGRVYLGYTQEYTETHGLAPKLEGRSSIARVGVEVHLTAGFGDDGFCGHWTLEIVVAQAAILRPGMRIAQIAYHTLQGERRPYTGRYQHQQAKPVSSRYADTH